MPKEQEHCQKIIDAAIAHAGKRVDGIEVTVSGTNIATSRFANNGMTQNQSPINEMVSIRVLVDGRQARLAGDQTAQSAIHSLVDNTISAAKLLEKDPELPELLSDKQSNGKAQERFDSPTAAIDAKDRANVIKDMIDIARQDSLIAAGTFSSGQYYRAIGNSKGLFKFHAETSAESSITVRAGESSGWAKAQSPRAKDVTPTKLAEYAAQKAKAGVNPGEIPPGQYTVVLEPSAVLDLVCFLAYDFSATSHTDKVSSLLNKQNQKVFGNNINITDDYQHPLQSGSAFDGEGAQRKAVRLVENGVFKNMVVGRRSAKKLKIDPTGHALQEPSALGEYAENLVFVGGDTSLEEMIATSDRAVLITRVWYVREVDHATLLMTGLTQDGTFLIENGKIKTGIKNMRFNVSIHEMLNKVLALGPSVRAAGEEGLPAVVPPMKVADFNFTEHSLF